MEKGVIKIIVATHKKYQMPQDKMYLPIFVGSKGKKDIGYQRDDTGLNISSKNPFYCELTGLYWAWKNLNADYIGLCHYRRYFASKKKSKSKNKFIKILKEEELVFYLQDNDIIVPKKRKYYIETLYNHYKHTMHVETLDETKKIIEKKYKNYLPAFNRLYKRKSAHMFNMFVMKKNIFDNYCDWLFNILTELEKKMNNKKYDEFHARFYGRISELLLDVYLETNNLSYKEIPFIYMEKINWWNKGMSFLKAKFLGVKYGKSF